MKILIKKNKLNCSQKVKYSTSQINLLFAIYLILMLISQTFMETIFKKEFCVF